MKKFSYFDCSKVNPFTEKDPYEYIMMVNTAATIEESDKEFSNIYGNPQKIMVLVLMETL